MRSLKAGDSQTKEGQQGQIFFEKEIWRLVCVPTETSRAKGGSDVAGGRTTTGAMH